ncbi:MAG: hypothetical protein PW790_00430 [Parvibaculaceae bacterium]|nr:hypothetical protein [Parvibaculaceae bacterium]
MVFLDHAGGAGDDLMPVDARLMRGVPDCSGLASLHGIFWKAK